MSPADGAEPTEGAEPGRSRWGSVGLIAGHAAAAAVATAGVVAQVVRPLAPSVGPAPPAASFFDAAFLERAAAYRGPLRVAGATQLAISLAVPVLVAATPAGRRLAVRLARLAGPDRPARAAALVAVAVVVATSVARLPLSFWAGYVHEGEWGFRTQGLGGWARDWVVGHGPAWLAAAVLAGAATALYLRLPRVWPVAIGLGGAALSAVLIVGAPLVLEPLEFRFSPLPPGPVRDEVERVLDHAGADVDTILVADASRRTTKENAYVSGLGPTRRVVLYDTLIANRPVDEIGQILAHELGHDRNGDLFRYALLSGTGAVVATYGLAAVLALRSRRTPWTKLADPRAVVAVIAALAVAQAVTLPLANWISRRAEAAADAAALEYTDDPETFVVMQQAIAVANLSEPDPPRWVQFLWGSHPSAVERIGLGLAWGNRAGTQE